MASSYQSTSFQSSARPVDTFVRQSTVPLIEEDGFSQLTKALSAVNPVLDMYMQQTIEDEKAEGFAIALEESADGFKDLVKDVRKNNGEKEAKKLIGGSIFADRAYQKTKASILGGTIQSNFENKYTTTVIDGKHLNQYSFDSDVFQGWLSDTRTEILESASDINPRYINEHFLPKLSSAVGSISTHHIEQNQDYKIELIKNQAIPLVKQVILFQQDPNQKNFVRVDNLIQDYELLINQLGLSSEDRGSINKLILNSLQGEAENLVLVGDGDEDDALEIMNLALLFPYGPNGSSNLSQHPDFLTTRNSTIKSTNTTLSTQNTISKQEAEKNKNIDINNNLKLYREALKDPNVDANQFINYLQEEYPQDAVKFLNIAAALDGTSEENYINLRNKIDNGDFIDATKARMAATSWINNPNTPKTSQNIKLYDDLMDRINSVDTGLFRSINPYLTEYSGYTKGILQNDENVNLAGLLVGPINGIQKKNAQAFNDEFRDFVIKNPNATQGQTFTEYKRLRGIYLNKLQIDVDKLLGNPLDNNNNQSNNTVTNNMEGVNNQSEFNKRNNIQPAFASEITQEDIDRERALDEEEARSYLVQAGDTLTSIAESFGTTVSNIMKANNITNADVITAGQELIMPIVNTIGDAVVPESDLTNRSVLDEIDITQPFDFNSLYRLALEVGFPPEDAKTAAAIALAESSGRAAIDTVQSGLDPNKENEFSLGLWQIDMQDTPGYMVGEERRPQFGIESNEELYNPLTNAKAAKILYDRRGGKFTDWATFNDGKYKDFLPKN